MSKSETSRGHSRPNAWRSAAARRLRALAGNVRTTEEAVSVIVHRLLSGVTFPPTDLDAIAGRIDAEIEFDESLLGSGALERSAIGYRILCSPHQPKVRQRFTISHEMAHIIFERTGPHCPRRGKELELLCDRISAALIIPDEVFRTVIGTRPNIRLLLKLARTCEASLQTALIRTTELCRDCSAVLSCEDETERELYGRNLKWMGKYAASQIEDLWLLTSESPRGQTTRRLLTPDGTRLLHIEWAVVGPNQRPMILLQNLLG